MPSGAGRLRAGVWTLAAAGATGGASVLGTSVTGDGFHTLGAGIGAGLLLPTAVCAGTLRDLRGLPSVGRRTAAPKRTPLPVTARPGAAPPKTAHGPPAGPGGPANPLEVRPCRT
ncbi:hypothetical protein [Yinghuangia seranimata]|uniref:hypothetical protein n=1 Tax=Yinghuangia seranimata TaxID=408067 RepID=UPI00248C133E|nr:hypothetical protein [Yinghuangia seranimata]MDI2129156.1 hypothetical protein [Yinghuangia seranimata]